VFYGLRSKAGLTNGETTMTRKHLYDQTKKSNHTNRLKSVHYLGACSEVVLSRPDQKPLVGYIERNSEADLALHLKARELADEYYLEDFAAELNEDYFNGELKFQLKWSHSMVANWGNARGLTARRQGKVIYDGKITVSYLLSNYAYTDGEEMVEYVVMHEMAHMLEMNHSYKFWQIVARNSAAVRGHSLYEGKDFPIDLTPPSKHKIYVDSRSRKGAYLASTGYKEGGQV